MGRKTWQSLGRLLPGRDNVVLSRDTMFSAEGGFVFSSLADVLAHYVSEEEIMIIGGSTVYQLAMPITQKLYVTQIHSDYEGDTYFPELSERWREVFREDHLTKVDIPKYSFLEMERL
jgi:dihydrofolate reductase